MAHRNRWFTELKMADLSMAMLNNQMVLHSLNFQQFKQVKTHHFPRLVKLGLFFTFFGRFLEHNSDPQKGVDI